jgi:Putative quorum-sensing-regulated virulence factor
MNFGTTVTTGPTPTPTPTPGRARPIDPSAPMPWGKHKGVPIAQVPRDYLVWCLQNTDACNPAHERYWPEFRAALEAMIGPGAPPPPPPVPSLQACLSLLAARGHRCEADGDGFVIEPEPSSDLAAALRVHGTAFLAMLRLCGPAEPEAPLDRVRAKVRVWYRSLSTRYHPDRGGSDVQQLVVNEAYRDLLKILDELEGSQDP